MSESATITAVRSTLAAFAAGDRGALRRALGRDYFTHTPGPEEAPAVAAMGQLVDDVLGALPDMTIRILELEDRGEGLVAGKVSMSGTNSGGLWGAPPTGRPLELDLDVRVRPVDGGLAFTIDGITAPALIGLLREVGLVNPADEMHLPPRNPGQIPELVLRLAFNGQVADKPCSHLDQVRVTRPSHRGCDECGPGGVFPTGRMCMTCGHLGCCDTSTHKHARLHYQETGHPLMRSTHGTERWMWCYEDGVLVGGATLERLAVELGA